MSDNLNGTAGKKSLLKPIEWTGWGTAGAKCPVCLSNKTKEVDNSADGLIAAHRHCNTCNFDGMVYIY